MTIEVSSASHSQGNYFRVTIDGEVINVPGERGIGLVIVEKGTRKVSMARMFDTELDPEECIKLNNLLLQAHPDAMLIMGVKDDGSRSLSLDLIQTITLLGSKHIKALGYRDSWIFVVRKGKPHRAREVKDSEKAVTLRIPRSPRLRSLVISSSSYQVGNNFSLCINGQPHGGVSYSGDDYRGIVMVVLNNHGEVLFNQIYDTFTCSMESDQLENAIRWQQAQSEGMLMVLGVKDEGSRHLSASLKALIESMGSKEIKELGFRDSWCFLCRIGRPKSAKEGRSSSPVTLSWVPRLYRPTLPPNQKYSIHYQPPNFSHSLPLSSSLPSSLAPNLVAHQSEAKTTENIVKIKKAYSPPIITKPLVDQPVTSVHQKNAPGAGGVEVGMSVRNNRARRRDTFS